MALLEVKSGKTSHTNKKKNKRNDIGDGRARKENNWLVNKDIKDSKDGREIKENNWSVNKDIKDSEDVRERKENN